MRRTWILWLALALNLVSLALNIGVMGRSQYLLRRADKALDRIRRENPCLQGAAPGLPAAISPLKVTILDDGGANLKVESCVEQK